MILAFVGGYVDAAGYIKFDGLFTSSITGNMVAACASVYKTFGVLSRAMVCISFGLGGAIAVAFALKLKLQLHWKERYVAMLLYTLEIVVLAVTMILGLIYEEEIKKSMQDWHLILVASLMGASMGIHNSAAKETIPNVPATTVMTMTLVALSIHFSNTLSYFLARYGIISLISPYPKDDEVAIKRYFDSMTAKHVDAETKLETTFRPMLFFLIGALVGTVITWNATYWSIFVPMALCAALVADIYAGELNMQLKKDAKELRKVEHNLAALESQNLPINNNSQPTPRNPTKIVENNEDIPDSTQTKNLRGVELNDINHEDDATQTAMVVSNKDENLV